MSFLSKIFTKLKDGFSSEAKTTTIAQQIDLSVEENKIIDANFLDDFEEELIRSDLGPSLALDFSESMRLRLEKGKLTYAELQESLKEFLLKPFAELKAKNHEVFKLALKPNTLNVILVVGVNGVGKTTSVGKLAYRLKNQGEKVLIAAGDTFRAAAEEQLTIWSQRSGVDILQLDEGSKSSAVVYKAIEKAKAENYTVLIIDTAGRLQNKQNLMDELKKLREVIEKNSPNPEFETMLVLDASTGQNAIAQAEKFMEVADVNSLILTKFDGTAKAGVVFSLAYNFKLPVKFIGVGEGMEDLRDFDLNEFLVKYFD